MFKCFQARYSFFLPSFVMLSLLYLSPDSAYSQEVILLPEVQSNEVSQYSVNPIGEIPVYGNSPSSWTGNLFNRPIGEANRDDQFEVIGTTRYPSLSGTQVWVELQATVLGDVPSDSPCLTNSCWAYLGLEDAPTESIDLEGGMAAEAFGNFVFTPMQR